MEHVSHHKEHMIRTCKRRRRYIPKREVERRKSRKRRVKHARMLDRMRKTEIEEKFGYYTYHQCTSKRYYKDRRSVEDALLSTQAVFGGSYYAYHCPLCGGWHLSTHDFGDLNEAFGSS